MKLNRTSPIEALESRIAPAGIVTVGYDAVTGILTLTGDGASNLIDIYKTGPATYRIEGNLTTLDGAVLTLRDIGNIKSLTINSGGGDDRFTLTNLNTLDDLAYFADTGTGTDSLVATDLVVKKGVAIDFGLNGGSAGFNGDTTTIGKDVTVVYGPAGGSVGFGAVNTTIKGAVVLTGGGSDDQFFLGGDIAKVGKGIRLVGAGANDLISIDSAISATVGTDGAGKSIDFDGGADDDELRINGGVITLKGALAFIGADGANEVNVEAIGLNVGGDLGLTGTTGDDTLKLNPYAFSVKGAVNVDLGAGANILESETATTIFGKTLTVNTLGDQDILNFFGKSLSVKKAVEINTGGGDDDFFINVNTVNLGDSVTVTSGAGADRSGIRATRLTIGGSLTFLGGEDDNNYEVGASLLAIKGGVKITGGAGVDFGQIIGDGTIKGDVNISLGDCTSGAGGQIFFMGGDSGLAGALRLGKTFTFTSTSLAALGDVFEGTDMTVAKAVSISMGDEQSFVTLENFSTKDNFTLNTGGGADYVEFERDNLFGPSAIGKIASIILGAGDDQILIGRSIAAGSNDFVRFLGDMTVDGGGGTNDSNDFLTQNVIGVPPGSRVGFTAVFLP